MQDDWSIGRKLVLNLGVRWDVETNMINNDYVTPQPLRDSLLGSAAARSSRTVDQPVLKANGTCCDIVKVHVVDGLGGLDELHHERPLATGRCSSARGSRASARRTTC